jgi:hypothetical protein
LTLLWTRHMKQAAGSSCLGTLPHVQGSFCIKGAEMSLPLILGLLHQHGKIGRSSHWHRAHCPLSATLPLALPAGQPWAAPLNDPLSAHPPRSPPGQSVTLIHSIQLIPNGILHQDNCTLPLFGGF